VTAARRRPRPALATVVAVSLGLCGAPALHAGEVIRMPRAQCQETSNGGDLASRELACGYLGHWQVLLVEQSPQLFEVILARGDRRLSSDFSALSADLPVQPGAQLEWHLLDGRPQALVVELAWGTPQEPWQLQPRILVNRVDADAICTHTVLPATQATPAQQARALAGLAEAAGQCPQPRSRD
jgi:hypothetical protein